MSIPNRLAVELFVNSLIVKYFPIIILNYN
nr:MAG TPA: hypothetical protein [Bacteriophage sp.]